MNPTLIIRDAAFEPQIMRKRGNDGDGVDGELEILDQVSCCYYIEYTLILLLK